MFKSILILFLITIIIIGGYFLFFLNKTDDKNIVISENNINSKKLLEKRANSQSKIKLEVQSEPLITSNQNSVPELLPEIIPSLEVTPILNTVYSIPIISIQYFPDQDNDGKLDSNITGIDNSLIFIRSKVNKLINDTITNLQDGSIYHGYKDNSARPSLNYSIINSIEFIEPIPVSDNEVPWKIGEGIYRPNYIQILNNINVCDYVDNQGVKEVWIWAYHFGNIEPSESNMAMGRNSKTYWNYSEYGDVSNSERTNDLPICSNTYTVYNYNYTRELAETIENHGHQIEAVLRFIDEDLFWNKFVGPYGKESGDRRCGWTHYPPNGTKDYDWHNTNSILSDCENWNPNGTSQKNLLNCHTWQGNICTNDGGIAFKKWWMQNIPGENNNLNYMGTPLKNWWGSIGDFDLFIQKEKSLTL